MSVSSSSLSSVLLLMLEVYRSRIGGFVTAVSTLIVDLLVVVDLVVVEAKVKFFLFRYN